MLSRRHSIRLSARAVAALMAFGPLLSGCTRDATGKRSPHDDDPTTGSGATSGTTQGTTGGTDTGDAPPEMIDWETFLAELEVLTRTQYNEPWDQAAYVEEVAALMGLLDVTDATFQDILDRYRDATRGFPEIRTAHDGGDYEVAILQFEPGESIDLHNHPRMTGVILCLTGAVDIDAYNLLDRTSESGDLLIERVAEVTLAPGDYATLTESRGNIHALVAHEWCELLDVFTPPYTPDRIREYRWYGRSDEPVEGDSIFAAWERS